MHPLCLQQHYSQQPRYENNLNVHQQINGQRRYSTYIQQIIQSVQSLSRVQLFVTPWTAARLPCPSPTPRAHSNSSDVIQLSHPLLSPSSPALNLFQCITQHKKEQNYAICSNMDELEIVILNRVSQKDKVKCHMVYHLYVESKI